MKSVFQNIWEPVHIHNCYPDTTDVHRIYLLGIDIRNTLDHIDS